MTNSQRFTLKFGAILLGGTALSSCGGNGNGGQTAVTPQPTPTTATAQETNFGTAFGVDFRATANSEPAAVADGDIVPVNLTTEPAPIT